ncbi:MAG TPA: hypothetical protein VFP84_19215 [Kofleriaceae bacterium]|nr:hypothetical protein [Kofleriaceae bacterium]
MASRTGLAIAGLIGALGAPAGAAPAARRPIVLHIGGAEITAEVKGKLDLTTAELTTWISTAASAVTAYFGKFPVDRYRIAIEPIAGEGGIGNGTTWSYGGAHTRMRIGEHATAAQLSHDWVMTHEMVHTAFPDQEDAHHWIEEGSATYIEPLARSWANNYPPGQVWADLYDNLPKGLPRAGDHGLDHTATWGRTYWGGALFCLLADVEIRERTHGQRGLIDAMRAILAAGGNSQVDWPIDRAFAIADKALGVPALTDLYKRLKDTPVTPDLDALWRDLGVIVRDGKMTFDDAAPKAAIRKAISTPPATAAASSSKP